MNEIRTYTNIKICQGRDRQSVKMPIATAKADAPWPAPHSRALLISSFHPRFLLFPFQCLFFSTGSVERCVKAKISYLTNLCEDIWSRLNQKTTNRSSLPSPRISENASLVLQIYVSANDGPLYWRLYTRWHCGFCMWVYGTRRCCLIWVGMHGRVGLRRPWKARRLWLVLLCECYHNVLFGKVITNKTIEFCSYAGLYSCGIHVLAMQKVCPIILHPKFSLPDHTILKRKLSKSHSNNNARR